MRQLFRLAAIVHAGCAGHHADGIAIELTGDACFLFVSGKSEHADAGNQDNAGISIPQFGGIRGGEFRVISGVVFAIGNQAAGNGFFQAVNRAGLRIPFHVEGADASANKMIGATGAQSGKLPGVFGICKGQGFRALIEVPNVAAGSGALTAKIREDGAGDFFRRLVLFELSASEQRGTLGLLMLHYKLTHLINGCDGIQIAFALRHSPGKQAMAA